jgi:hypothetical protein
MTSILWTAVHEFWHVLSEMAPYLLLGFLVAGWLSVLIPAKIVEKHLGKGGLGPVLKASLIGIPLPLCSCGVIPVAASLRKHGASRGATTAFLMSTPQTGVDSILVTFSLLGPAFAILRPVLALISGVVGGLTVHWLGNSAGATVAGKEKSEDACCSTGPTQPKWIEAFRHGFVTLPRDLAKALLLGLGIAGAIAVALPEDFFSAVPGGGVLTMILMLGVGIPVYICATASVPIAAALIIKGLSPGAALVFLVAGSAINAATITAMWKMLGRRATTIHVIVVAITALSSGLLLDHLFTIEPRWFAPSEMEMLPGVFKDLCAVILLGVLGMTFVPLSKDRADGSKVRRGGEQIEFSIRGMSCEHCVQAVRTALLACSGVDAVEVSLEEGRTEVRGSGLDGNTLRRTVEQLGYTIAESNDPQIAGKGDPSSC